MGDIPAGALPDEPSAVDEGYMATNLRAYRRREGRVVVGVAADAVLGPAAPSVHVPVASASSTSAISPQFSQYLCPRFFSFLL